MRVRVQVRVRVYVRVYVCAVAPQAGGGDLDAALNLDAVRLGPQVLEVSVRARVEVGRELLVRHVALHRVARLAEAHLYAWMNGWVRTTRSTPTYC